MRAADTYFAGFVRSLDLVIEGQTVIRMLSPIPLSLTRIQVIIDSVIKPVNSEAGSTVCSHFATQGLWQKVRKVSCWFT